MPLTANKKRRVRGPEGRLGEGLPAVSTQFYQGGLLCFDATDALVKASPVDGYRLAGVMPSELLTGASVVDKRAFNFDHEEWFPHSGLSAGSVGRDAFVIDDNLLGVGPGGAESDQAFTKSAADGAAATATSETVIGMVARASKLIGARFVPAAALTADNTNNAVITVSKRDSAGANKTTIASLTTNVASGNWVQWAPKALTLGLAAAIQVAAESSITFEIAKGGTGVVVPAGTLELFFGAGAQVRAGEIKGFQTFDGVAGVWITVGRFTGRDA